MSPTVTSLIPEYLIEQVLSSVKIVDFIGQFVALKKEGAKYHTGQCPFHDGDSFTVSPKGFFYCFGCERSGDVFEFLVMRGWTFPDAVATVAQHCGVLLDRHTPPPPNWEEDDAARKRARERAQAEHLVEREKEWARIATKQLERFDKAGPASEDHPYLVAKQITSAAGLKQEYGKLLVPMRDAETKESILMSVQEIDGHGRKRNAPGGRTSCTRTVIGAENFLDRYEAGEKPILYICEGWATGWTLNDLTGAPAVVCFTKNNLICVTLAKRKRYPDARLIIAADNDRWTKNADGSANPGVTAAKAAAEAAGCEFIIPDFADLSESEPRHSDFNDLYCRDGREEAIRWLDPEIAHRAVLVAGGAALEDKASVDPSANGKAKDRNGAESGPDWTRDSVTDKTIDIAQPLFVPEQIRLERFLDSKPAPRRWIIENVLPTPVVGLLAAMGGAGKSMFIYTLGFAVASGSRFIGLDMAEPGGFLYLAAEDDESELHRRGLVLLDHFEGLARRTGEPFDRKLVAERIHVVSRVAENNLLTSSGRDGEVDRTPLVERLIVAARGIPHLRVIVIDPLSRFRGGAANQEEDATRFVETLEVIREQTGATVLALAHVSKLGIREGGGQELVRGSSALVDGVRWVGTLQPMRANTARNDYGLDADEAHRYLRFEIPKSNYAPPFPGLWLRRETGGVLVPVSLEETASSSEQVVKSEAQFMPIVEELQKLIGEKGPITRNAIRPHAGLAGVFKAGDKTVRSVIERAVREGYLIEKENLLSLPAEDE